MDAITQDMPGEWLPLAHAQLLSTFLSMFGGKPPKLATIMRSYGINSDEYMEKAMSEEQIADNLLSIMNAVQNNGG